MTRQAEKAELKATNGRQSEAPQKKCDIHIKNAEKEHEMDLKTFVRSKLVAGDHMARRIVLGLLAELEQPVLFFNRNRYTRSFFCIFIVL